MSASSPHAWLAAHWQALWTPVNADPAAVANTFSDLVNRYGAPARAYHNLEHLRHVLATIDALAHRARDARAVRLAAWFHDAVYDPRARDNEEQSAALAAAKLRGCGVEESLIGRVGGLILLTKTHAVPPGDVDAAVLLDADLAILGAPPAKYAAYAAAIRQEYAHVSDADFRRGRRAVLERFLQSPRLFQTDEMHQALDELARQNLRTEISQLA